MEDPVVVCCHVPERGECSSIYQSISLNSTYSPFVISMQVHLNSRRMATSVYPVNLFSIESYTNRFSRLSCENRSAHFVGERIRLTTETASDEGPMHIDLMHWNLQYIGKRPMNVVWNLLRSVQRKPSSWFPVCNYCVWLSECVVNSGENPILFVASNRIFYHSPYVPEFLENPLLDV